MGFMQPETTHERFLRIERKNGDGDFVPADCYERQEGDEVEDLGIVWAARLSAPGYLDCTDWSGPFDTEEAALRDLCEMYDLCRECMYEDCEAESAEACRAASESQ